MAKIETLGSLAQEAENKKMKAEGAAADKAARIEDRKNANKDQVITLDLEGRNQGFRESKNALPALREKMGGLKEKIASIGSWLKNKFKNRDKGEMLRVVPEESTTENRYREVVQKLEQKQQRVEAGAGEIEAQQQAIAELTAQQESVIELGDEWASQHDSSESEGYAEIEAKHNSYKELAQLVDTYKPLTSNNAELSRALKSGSVSVEQAQQAREAVKKIKLYAKGNKVAMGQLDKADKFLESLAPNPVVNNVKEMPKPGARPEVSQDLDKAA